MERCDGSHFAGRLSTKSIPKIREVTRSEFIGLIPHLSPNSAAAAAFAVATSAEVAALTRAQRADVPDADEHDARVRVRGTKNVHRDRRVPIVSDEQWLLLDFVRQHAAGSGDRLFSLLQNFRRDLAQACEAAGVPHVYLPRRMLAALTPVTRGGR